MSPIIVRRPRAEGDLIAIWSYIATDNESAADRMLVKIQAALNRLAKHPLSGRPRPELHESIRSFPIGRYVVFYRPQTSGGIELVRVMSSYLDIGRDDVR